MKFETKIHENQLHFFRRITGDERRYLQILINFLSNAIKFSKKDGRIVVEVKVSDT